MKKLSKILAAVFAALFALGAFSACSAQTTSQTDLEYVQAKGTLLIGVTEYEPMNYQVNGEWTGFDTEFALAVCEKLGVEAEFVLLADWDTKFTELDAKSIDCVWNGMTITEKAKEAASISTAYAENAQVVVMKEANLDKYTTAESLADLTIAVEGGSAGEQAAEAAGLENLVISSSQALALTEVSSGSSDACIIDLTMANAMTGEGTSNATLGYTIKLEAEEYGIAFRQGSDLCDKVNEIIAELMEDGTLDALAEKYEITLIK